MANNVYSTIQFQSGNHEAEREFIRIFEFIESFDEKGLEFADIGYVLVSGQTTIAGKGDDLLNNPDVGRLFLGG